MPRPLSVVLVVLLLAVGTGGSWVDLARSAPEPEPRIQAPVRGSAIVANSERIGLVPYRTRRQARIYWFSIAPLLKPAVLDLGPRPSGRPSWGRSRPPASRASCRARRWTPADACT